MQAFFVILGKIMLEIKVDFADALIDIDRKITLTGAPAQVEVVVSTKTERAGQVWRSETVVQSDDKGEAELGLELIYNQKAENAAATELFPLSVHHSLQTVIEAQSGELKSSALKPTVLTQRLTHETVQRVEIREEGIKGVLFVPAGAAVPAVLLLKRQAAGDVDEAHAALYAARGYAVLALEYEQTPALEVTAESLAYFSQALDWLREKVRPKHHFVAVSGYEEGAELALLLGVWLAEQVSAVIACEPTAPAPSGIHPLHIEEMQGPLLLASGREHGSSAYQESIGKRLQQSGFDYNFQWYDFEGVAGGLRFPHIPTTPFAEGAEQVQALAEANKSLWFSIIGFLHQAVAEAAPGGALGQPVQ